jgi:hypothetical protein
MTEPNDDFDEEAWEYYDKVKDALNGLFDVLNLALEPENILYQCGVDNLKALKHSLVDLLRKDYDTILLQETLHEIEFNMKKSFYSKPPKKSKIKGKKDEEKTV